MDASSPPAGRTTWAWILAGSACTLAVVGLAYTFAARGTALPENIGFPGYWSIIVIGSATSGLVLALRRPANAIAWLFLGSGFIWGIVQLADGYASWAVAEHGSTTVVARLAAGGLDWTWIPAQASLALVFALFPDGRFLSPRWRTWTLIAAASTLLATVSNAMVDTLSVYVGVRNPLGVGWVGRFAGPSLTALAVLLVIGLANLVVRFRRSAGDERQQIKWLVPSTIVIALAYIVYVIGFAIPDRKPSGLVIGVVEAMLLLALAAIPVSIATAVLRYRLYDIDLVIRKTVVFGVLVALLIGVGAVVVILVGVGIVPSLSDAPTVPVLAGLGFGLLAIPLYRVATRIADRVVYAGRESPYTILASFSGRIGEVYSHDDVLPRMATVLREGTRAGAATVWLRVDDELRPAATAPSGSAPPPAPPGDAVDVVQHGERLGALSVTMPTNDPLDAGRATLIRHLAAQAGPVLRNVRLIEELRASRQRLVAAQDEERRRIERNIHDGAQQQLVALSVQLGLAGRLAERDPPKMQAVLAELQVRTTEALEDLRDLARGIYPPLLADQGLAAAVEAQARKAATPTAVRVDGIDRYPRAIESAVYFSVLECLQNVAKYADAAHTEITLAQANGHLRFEVRDDGRGFDPASTRYGTGLQGIADRMDAIGGELDVRSTPGAGTVVVGVAPLG